MSPGPRNVLEASKIADAFLTLRVGDVSLKDTI